MSVRRGGLLALVLLSGAGAGCGRPPAEQLATSVEDALSWAATARTVAGHWLSGRAPGRYTRVTLQAAQESLERSRARIASSPRSLADDQVARALPLFEQAELTVSRMWLAVERSDGAALRARSEELEGLERRLRALEAAPPESP